MNLEDRVSQETGEMYYYAKSSSQATTEDKKEPGIVYLDCGKTKLNALLLSFGGFVWVGVVVFLTIVYSSNWYCVAWMGLPGLAFLVVGVHSFLVNKVGTVVPVAKIGNGFLEYYPRNIHISGTAIVSAEIAYVTNDGNTTEECILIGVREGEDVRKLIIPHKELDKSAQEIIEMVKLIRNG